MLSLTVACASTAHAQGTWRSALYPSNWQPGDRDSQNRFLHDFSYAGYHAGARSLPEAPSTRIFDVTATPYFADSSGRTDATIAIQRAIDDAEATTGGGIVYLPEGTYCIKPQNSNDYALRVERSNIVLRGAGRGSTRLFLNETFMRGKDMIRFAPASTSWTSPITNSTVNLTADLDYPTTVLPLASVNNLNVGDWIIVRGDITPAFIAEHDQTNIWTTSMIPQTYYRRITSVDATNKTVTIDAPTRYYLKLRDNARIYKIAAHIEEVGIENLSVAMRENPKTGLAEDDYNVQGTAAYDVHQSNAVAFTHVVNGWVRNVETYRPPTNANGWHILSCGVYLRQSRFITVTDSHFSTPQYTGGGGNGYMFSILANDTLVTRSTGENSRHNFIFQTLLASGAVIHRSTSIGDARSKPAEFHRQLSVACLVDSMTLVRSVLEAKRRDTSGSSPKHGHSATQSVFWNTTGQEAQPNYNYAILSSQYGHGYAIGTRGAMPVIRLTGGSSGTEPPDYTEGEGQGATLEPQSLYEDQLARRLNLQAMRAGTVVNVSTSAQLSTAIASAVPSDTIILADGTYTATGNFAVRNKVGTPDNLITVKAANKGKAIISGGAFFNLTSSAYVVIDGMTFTNTGQTAIKLTSCNNVRATNNRFRLTEEGTSLKWLFIGGANSHHNRVDHNIFENKSDLGNFITIDGAASQASQFDVIDHNYFRNIGIRVENGLEAIRVGFSGLSLSSSFTTIEYNLFENCDGDPEIISVKTSDTTVRFNTFRASQGAVTARHGNRSNFYGNFFFGANKAGTGGIRVYGDDHRIYNNYFEGLTGNKTSAPIAVTGGDADDAAPGKDLTLHYRPRRITIVNNTLAGNVYHIEIGFTNNNQWTKPPIDVVIANNIVRGATNKLVNLITQPQNLNLAGNIMFPIGTATVGVTASEAAIRIVDPQLVTTDGMQKLSSTSPAINVAAGVYNFVFEDADGQMRDTATDTGADEFSAATPTRRPLTAADFVQTTATEGTVTGRIMTATNQAISGVVVILQATDTLITQRTVTDAQGRFAFAAIKANDVYTVSAVRRNFTFAPSKQTFSMNADTVEINFTGAPRKGRVFSAR